MSSWQNPFPCSIGINSTYYFQNAFITKGPIKTYTQYFLFTANIFFRQVIITSQLLQFFFIRNRSRLNRQPYQSSPHGVALRAVAHPCICVLRRNLSQFLSFAGPVFRLYLLDSAQYYKGLLNRKTKKQICHLSELT
jgi:hypothetical protein